MTVTVTVHAGRRLRGRAIYANSWVILARATGPRRSPRGSATNARRDFAIYQRISEVLAALSHPQRIRILAAMLKGPATYQNLQAQCPLQPGPFYHHIAALRVAGLVSAKQRDTYELTAAGRDALGLSLAVIGTGRMRLKQ